MHLFRSRMAVAVLTLATACGGHDATSPATGDLPPLGPGEASHIVVAPSSVTMAPGDSVQLHAYVVGLSAANQGVRWSVANGGATVSNSGVVYAKCYPTGTSTVVASSTVDTTIAGAAQVVVASTGLPSISLSTITDATTGENADLNHVAGSIAVTTSLEPAAFPCHAITEAELVIHRDAGDTVVAQLALDTLKTSPYTLTMLFHSDAKVNGVPAFPNGDYSVRVAAVVSGVAQMQSTSTIHFTVHN